MSAATPGQAAFEAFQASRAARLPMMPVTAWTHPAVTHARKDWETAAQAAIAAARMPTLVINFDEKITEERAAEIRAALNRAAAPPGATIRRLRAVITEMLLVLVEYADSDQDSEQIAKWNELAGLPA